MASALFTFRREPAVRVDILLLAFANVSMALYFSGGMIFLSSLTHRCSYLLSCSDNWGTKAQRRRTTGTGRCRYLKTLPRKFKVRYVLLSSLCSFLDFFNCAERIPRGHCGQEPEEARRLRARLSIAFEVCLVAISRVRPSSSR